MKKLILIVALTALILSCNTTEPLPPGTNITLKTEDVSSIEAWIKITTNNIQLPTTVTLKKNNTVEKTISLLTQDSVIYIDSLLPKTTYNFQAFIHSNTQTYESNELSVATMDTTSHNFTWQTWTFGKHSSSVLNDVAIINENNIWAVGEIYLNDSLGNPDPEFYNLLIWDGNNWNIKRINFTNSQGQTFLAPIKSVFVFNENDIWLGMDQMIHWDGNEFTEVEIPSTIFHSWINKIWGTSSPEGTSNDLYIVGNNGNIAHYTNGQWTKIESGTELPIRDIWGDFNTKTGKYEILAVAAEVAINNGSKVLRINGNSVTEESNNGLSWDVGGIWFKSGSKYYVAGAGIHYKHFLSDTIWNRYPQGLVTNYVGYHIRGSDINDVFAAGSFLEIAHFNGVSWHNYLNEISSGNGALGGISINGDMIVIVGFDGSSALVVIGRRN